MGAKQIGAWRRQVVVGVVHRDIRNEGVGEEGECFEADDLLAGDSQLGQNADYSDETRADRIDSRRRCRSLLYDRHHVLRGGGVRGEMGRTRTRLDNLVNGTQGLGNLGWHQVQEMVHAGFYFDFIPNQHGRVGGAETNKSCIWALTRCDAVAQGQDNPVTTQKLPHRLQCSFYVPTASSGNSSA